MESLLSQSHSAQTPATMTARVLNDAKRAYGGFSDQAYLERCARDAVAEIWGESIKVTTFVPVLAMRLVRDAVAGTAPAQKGIGSDATA